MVKADAYGHGAVAVTRTLAAEGCRRVAVVRVGEAAALRSAGIALEILVLGGASTDEEANALVALRATPVLHDAGQLSRIEAAARRGERRVPVHVEIDTGMRRMGVPCDAAPALLAAVRASADVRLAGLATHLARADEPGAPEAAEQLRLFEQVVRGGPGPGSDVLLHVANSAATLANLSGTLALAGSVAVRPGLSLYGVTPFSGDAGTMPRALRPVMSLVARVVALRRVAAGTAVGYGATWRAPRATTIATVAAGYGDGVPWSLGNRGVVQIGGLRHPIAGRVSMDFTTLDAGESPVSEGDEALFFGVLGEARLPVEEVAALAGTIPYELVVRVGARVPRVIDEAP